MTESEKAPAAPAAGHGRMSVGEHLEELRRRVFRAVLYLVAALAVCLVFNDRILGFILKQPYEVLRSLGHGDPRMPVLGSTEMFLTWLKVGFMAAVLLSSPFVARELWGFVAAGLYPHEKKWVRIFAPFSYLLFLSGVAFLYFVVLPPALKFLYSFGFDVRIPGAPDATVVTPMPDLAQYVAFYITMSLIMGVVFQLPLVMLFFMATKIIPISFFTKYRRHFIVGSVALLAVLTPTGDAMSLVLVTLPVLALYEIGILLGRLFGRRKE
jgi:sec-independent protein translocase protein TatC